jgi:hypothetical protein
MPKLRTVPAMRVACRVTAVTIRRSGAGLLFSSRLLKEGRDMASKPPAVDSGVLDRISRNIAVIGSIIAALVGMNTALTTCSSQTVARHQTFRQAVEAEELYWRNLYTDYLSVFRKEVGQKERDARLFALSVLAQRDIPDFGEHSLGPFGGGDAKRLATARLTTLKGRLNEVLARPESSSPEVAAARQDQSFASAVREVRTAEHRDADQPAPPPQAVQSTGGSSVNYLPQVLATGDRKGWDLDVFWCGGGGSEVETLNYNAGLGSARALAALSARGDTLGGERLGRVRLIMLPEARQGGIYPTRGTGYEIRPERSAEEQAVAAAARAAIPAGGAHRIVPSDTRTAFYLSLFSCRAGQPPAGRPLSNAGSMPVKA